MSVSEESVITIVIAGHGIEDYDKPLSDPNVRILSLAGKPFCYSFVKTELDGTTTGHYIIDGLIDDFEQNPDKNTLHILRDFTIHRKHIYDEAMDFTADYFTNVNPNPDAFKHGSLEKKGTMRLLSVQNEKRYQIKRIARDSLMYGVFVINTRNPPEGLDIEPVTDLTEPVFSLQKQDKPYLYTYISEIKDKSKANRLSYLYGLFQDNEIKLSKVIEFFRELGFSYINIVDLTCRVAEPTYTEPIDERLMRRIRRHEQGPMTELMGRRNKRKLEEMPGGTKKRKKLLKLKKTKKTKKRNKTKKTK